MRALCGDRAAAFSAIVRAACTRPIDGVVCADSTLRMGYSGDCAIAASAQRSPRTRATSAARVARSLSDGLIGGLRGSRGKTKGEGRINSGKTIHMVWSARSKANTMSAARDCVCLRLAVELLNEGLYRMWGPDTHLASLSPVIHGATRLASISQLTGI